MSYEREHASGKGKPVRRLLRTIRFDGSDAYVYDLAAEPGEWAVSGAFAFSNAGPGQLVGKTRQAFANGFLGVQTFGRSTFATVGEATEDDIEAVVLTLADHFVTNYGAPSQTAARSAAEAEVAFIEDLVKDAPLNTVFTVRRTFTDDEHKSRSELREEFRTIKPPTDEPLHARIWTIDATDDAE
ncbi:MAG: DUF6505 family protein [Pseudomonadota bacterium]